MSRVEDWHIYCPDPGQPAPFVAVGTSGPEPWAQVDPFENSYTWTLECSDTVDLAHGNVGDFVYGNEPLRNNQVLTEDGFSQYYDNHYPPTSSGPWGVDISTYQHPSPGVGFQNAGVSTHTPDALSWSMIPTSFNMGRRQPHTPSRYGEGFLVLGGVPSTQNKKPTTSTDSHCQWQSEPPEAHLPSAPVPQLLQDQPSQWSIPSQVLQQEVPGMNNSAMPELGVESQVITHQNSASESTASAGWALCPLGTCGRELSTFSITGVNSHLKTRHEGLMPKDRTEVMRCPVPDCNAAMQARSFPSHLYGHLDAGAQFKTRRTSKPPRHVPYTRTARGAARSKRNKEEKDTH